MEWPYRRFIKAFDSFQRRQFCDELRQRRIAHIAALYANTNLDGEDAQRGQVVLNVEEAYEELITNAWNGSTPEKRLEESGELNTAFMRASRRRVTQVMLPGEEVLSGEM